MCSTYVAVKRIALYVVLGLVLFVSSAHAEDFYFFRVDSELDVPIAIGTGATVRWACNGTGQGIVTDGTASESTNSLDGIIKIASTSAENDSSHAGCNASEAIVGSVSMDGWRYRNFSGTVSAAGSNITFTTRASMDYTILVNGVTDELSTAITLNGTAASATYSGTVASQSYSNYSGSYKKYIAGSTSGGTVTAGGDGYVNRTSSALTISSTATQSVDFGTTDDSSLDESGLLFGYKFDVLPYVNSGTPSNLSGATVTAGNSYGVSCGESGATGTYYCAVPLAHTGTSAKAVKTGYADGTTTYSLRSIGSSSQITGTIRPQQSQGGCSSCGVTPSPTPTPTPSPSSSPMPTPTVSITPTSTPSATSTTQIKLFRKANDPKVYVERNGILTWIRTLAEFNAAGYRWQDVEVISGKEFARLRIGGKLRVVRGIGYLRVRENPSLSGKIVGKVFPGEELELRAKDGSWYRAGKNGKDLGWIFGEYVNEL